MDNNNYNNKESWKLPLAEKAQIIEKNIIERHSIMGLYASRVIVPHDGGPGDYSTSTRFCDVAHSVCWTSKHLSGVCFKYAYLKNSGAAENEIEKVRLRADELFEAIYRCQLVTGIPGLQARGYLLGHGETYGERVKGSRSRNAWHQGTGEYSNFRWRGDPSHHNYSDSAAGMGHYYDMVAEGEQKERCKKAIDSLVSYWLDNDYKIYKEDRNMAPYPVLCMTDGKTLDTTILMAIGALKVAYHVTGKEKYEEAYEKLVTQYGVRDLKEFKVGYDWDDATHVMGHLENLFRIEKDSELLNSYNIVLKALWDRHKNDAQSLYNYIYIAQNPDAPDREKALREALSTLQTWPADMTLRPKMNSIRKDLTAPYPVYEAVFDNEYMWKGNLLKKDGWLSRIVKGVAVSPEDPMVIYAFDSKGDLYQSRDGAATANGWSCIDHNLKQPVRALAVGHKSRFLYIATDNEFMMTSTAGAEWEDISVPQDEGKPVNIMVDPGNNHAVYAITTRGVYRSKDYGEEFLCRNWETLTSGLPKSDDISFHVIPGKYGCIYAIFQEQTYVAVPALYSEGKTIFFRALNQNIWKKLSGFGFAYGLTEDYSWMIIDPNNIQRAFIAMKAKIEGLDGKALQEEKNTTYSFISETKDGAGSWNNSMTEFYEEYSKNGVDGVLSKLVPSEITCLIIDHNDSNTIYMGTDHGVMKSADGGKSWEVHNNGLEVALPKTIFQPHNSNWIFTGTPSGLFVSKDNGASWESANLCLQFFKNEKQQIGGASYVDAYWRAKYYGFIDDRQVTNLGY